MFAERAIRSLRKILRRLMELNNSKDWPSLVPDAVNVYNNHEHSSTKMAPNVINLDNASHVFETLYPNLSKNKVGHIAKPTFKVGQIVRVISPRERFEKSDKPSASEDLYIIG